MRDVVDTLAMRLMWRYAKWRGERPGCELCDNSAQYYTTDDGYLCAFCQGKPVKSGPIAAVRELTPADYLHDDVGWEGVKND